MNRFRTPRSGSAPVFRGLAAAALLTLAALPAAAQEGGAGDQAAASEPAAAAAPAGDEVLLSAGRLERLGEERVIVGEGTVVVRHKEMRLAADRAVYNEVTKDLIADGNVVFESGADRLQGEHLELNLDTRVGFVEQAQGFIQTYYFTGERIEKQGPDRYFVRRGTFTTCEGALPDWSFRTTSSDVTVDEYLHAWNPSLYVNGDGAPDLVVSNIEGTISIFLGNGDGTFAPRTDFATRDEPWALALADLNGDATPDLVVSNDRAGTVSIRLGKGDGAFGPRTDFRSGPTPRALALADLNGDGMLDLAVVNVGAATVSVLLGRGDGTFGLKSDVETGRTPVALAVADVNRDGVLDLMTANIGTDTVSVLRGNEDGSFGQKVEPFLLLPTLSSQHPLGELRCRNLGKTLANPIARLVVVPTP